ncbi:peptidyl-prolyl cis-trans isomerase [Bradyrhizobium manausense]|uniref:peptidylprolyl isomerase n=1 Tax=Bradyrhizobium manausense TaxID=989370 RepID=UPI001BA4BD6F|nr:peptidylprolyl isomerase [Bradyrhizobium manausense]MBR0791902.1 peptidyl-prolyl cis-trans isomerase [Bradyrhizobium manausense]
MNLLKEPLVHFLMVGAALFGAYAWMNRDSDGQNAGQIPSLQVSAGDIEWLAQNWTTQWRRPPRPEEMRGLVTDYSDELLLAREARALGLEDNDVIVRRRLAQKLTFLVQDTARRAEPSDADLQQFYAAHAEHFRSDARISLRQLYFNPQQRADARSDAISALQQLRGDGTLSTVLGDRLLLEGDFRDETEQSLSAAFGGGFARAVFALEPGAWSGPIQSGYGLHLVQVSARQDGQLRPFAELRDRVIEEWKREQETRAKELYLVELRKKYRLVVDDAVRPLMTPIAATSRQP